MSRASKKNSSMPLHGNSTQGDSSEVPPHNESLLVTRCRTIRERHAKPIHQATRLPPRRVLPSQTLGIPRAIDHWALISNRTGRTLPGVVQRKCAQGACRGIWIQVRHSDTQKERRTGKRAAGRPTGTVGRTLEPGTAPAARRGPGLGVLSFGALLTCDS